MTSVRTSKTRSSVRFVAQQSGHTLVYIKSARAEAQSKHCVGCPRRLNDLFGRNATTRRASRPRCSKRGSRLLGQSSPFWRVYASCYRAKVGRRCSVGCLFRSSPSQNRGESNSITRDVEQKKKVGE